MKVHDPTRKHGIDPQDAIHVAEHAAFVSDLDDDSPARQLRLGFDSAGRLLDVVVLHFDSGTELVSRCEDDGTLPRHDEGLHPIFGWSPSTRPERVSLGCGLLELVRVRVQPNVHAEALIASPSPTYGHG